MPNSGIGDTWRKGPTDWSNYLPIIGWKIDYVDGAAFTNKDGAWADAPGDIEASVASVTVYHVDNRSTWIGNFDEYMMRGEVATKLGKMMGETFSSPEWEAKRIAVTSDTWRPDA